MWPKFRRRIERFALAALALASLAGCGSDNPTKAGADPGPAYLPLDSPDNLVANLATAWEARDPAGYAALLYNGERTAEESVIAAPFAFYFDPDLPGLPSFWGRAEELVFADCLFGGGEGKGDSGMVFPGVVKIEATLAARDAWEFVEASTVDGDRTPKGCLRVTLDTQVVITLEDLIAGSTVIALAATRPTGIYAVPVSVEGQPRWRLWKWDDRNLRIQHPPEGGGPGNTELVTLSFVRRCYASPN